MADSPPKDPDERNAPTSRNIDPTTALLTRVEHRLVTRCGVTRASRLLVAVSGGGDSVALLELLALIAPRLDLTLEVAHFDHALRPESQDDARFVASLAQAHQLPFHLERWKKPRNTEVAQRHARYDFLAQTCREHNLQFLVVAHQLDDHIETVLMMLARGAGLLGSHGMRWRRPMQGTTLIRPLLDLRGEALRAWLVARQQTWREDPTNRDDSRSRNRVRNQAVPALDRALRPQWREKFAMTLLDVAAAHRLVDHLAKEALARARLVVGAEAVDPQHLVDLPELVRRTALQRWFEQAIARESEEATRPQINRGHLIAASRLIRDPRGGRSLSLPGGWTLHRERNIATLVHASGAELGTTTARLHLASHPLPAAEALARVRTGDLHRPDMSQWPSPRFETWTLIGADSIRAPLTLRTARPGDRVQLLGAPGTRRLARILQDRSVPRRFRAFWPIVEDALGIIWVPGAGIAERARIDATTQKSFELHLGPVAGLGRDEGGARAGAGPTLAMTPKAP